MKTKTYLTVDSLSCYKRSFDLSNYVWEIVLRWEHFARQTVGIQITKAVDSISANIAEGFGRYSKKDKIKFYHISYGSMLESTDWIKKSLARKLLSQSEYDYIFEELSVLPREIHQLIKFTNDKLAI